MPVPYDFPCKKCKHNYEEHIQGFRCATCWTQVGHDFRLMCRNFVGDNLKYLEMRQDES